MAVAKKVEGKEKMVGKAAYGSDLLGELNKFCREKGIQYGWLSGLGAVQKAALSYYDQQMREYQSVEIDRSLEITHLEGNISLKDGAPFVHAHVTLADRAGNAYGGHLGPGTVVFACEFTLEVFDGPPLERSFDTKTGLFLWDLRE